MKLKKEDLPVALELPVAKFRINKWENMSAAYVELKAGADATPLLEGLNGDMCHCPHWGYMLSGAIHVKYSDGTEEVCKAGEMFYWPGGHTVRVEEDTTYVDFSPKKEMTEVIDHINKKLETA